MQLNRLMEMLRLPRRQEAKAQILKLVNLPSHPRNTFSVWSIDPSFTTITLKLF